MPSVFVSSSWISRISYNRATRRISMTVKKGETWDYAGDEAMYQEWADADSKGEWFNQNLRGTPPLQKHARKQRIKRKRKGR